MMLIVALLAVAAVDEPRVLVLDVAASEADAPLARTLTASIADALGARKGTVAVTERELAALVDTKNAKSTLDCGESVECLAELSRWSSARFVLSGTLGRVGRTLTLTLSLADADAATVVAREASELDAGAKNHAAIIAALVARLFGDAPRAPRFSVPKGERASYAVFPLEMQSGGGITLDPAVARSLTDILAVEIKRVDGTTVVSIDDVAAMVSAEQKKSVLTCTDDTSCLMEIGAALDVDRLVVSSVAKVAHTYVVSARLLDVKKVRVLSRVTASFVGPDEQLIRAVRRCARAARRERRRDRLAHRHHGRGRCARLRRR